MSERPTHINAKTLHLTAPLPHGSLLPSQQLMHNNSPPACCQRYTAAENALPYNSYALNAALWLPNKEILSSGPSTLWQRPASKHDASEVKSLEAGLSTAGALQVPCSGAQGKGQYVRYKSLLKYVTSVAEYGKNYLVILSSDFLEHIIGAVPAVAGCLYCAACWLLCLG